MEMLRERVWKLPIFMSFVITMPVVSMAIVSVPVYASTTVLAVEPPIIIDIELTPNSAFSINITVANVEKLWVYQFMLYYNTTILTATDYGSYSPFTEKAFTQINDTAGWIFLAYSMPFGEKVGFSTVDPTPIARIDFTVDAYGRSSLDLRKSLLVTVDAEAIPHDVSDGYFDNRLQVVMATVDIDRDTLNLRSERKRITAYIQLPEGYDPEDIDATTILLNGTISPVLDPKYDFVTNSSEYLVDHDGDGILERMVKFNRAEVIGFIETMDFDNETVRFREVTLTISGTVSGGAFEGSGTVRLIV